MKQENKKKSLAQILAEESKRRNLGYRYFFYTLIIAQKDKVYNEKTTSSSKIQGYC